MDPEDADCNGMSVEEEEEIFEIFFDWIYAQSTHFQSGYAVYCPVEQLRMLEEFDFYMGTKKEKAR